MLAGDVARLDSSEGSSDACLLLLRMYLCDGQEVMDDRNADNRTWRGRKAANR